MKRCTVCKKLADNGDKFCQRCGSKFEYDPKVSPFSETKIILTVVTVLLVAWLITRSAPLKLPDPMVCSRTSYSRFRKIVIRSHKDVMAILAENYISSDHLSRVMAYKRDAQAMPVPECLETAKEEYVNYLDALYYTTVLSAWGAYDSATLRAESAARYLDSLNTKLDEVNACLPNCP